MRCPGITCFGFSLSGVYLTSWMSGGSAARMVLPTPGLGERRMLPRPNLYCLLQSYCCYGAGGNSAHSAPNWHCPVEEIKVFLASIRWGMEDKLPALYSHEHKTLSWKWNQTSSWLYQVELRRSYPHLSFRYHLAGELWYNACIHRVGKGRGLGEGLLLSWPNEIAWVSTTAIPLG